MFSTLLIGDYAMFLHSPVALIHRGGGGLGSALFTGVCVMLPRSPTRRAMKCLLVFSHGACLMSKLAHGREGLRLISALAYRGAEDVLHWSTGTLLYDPHGYPHECWRDAPCINARS